MPKAPPVITLSALEAQLFVADLGVACDFYVGRLGFELVFSYGEPAFYAQVARDSVRLNLRHVDEPVFVDGVREREQLLSASISLASSDDVHELFGVFQSAGVDFCQSLGREPWGAHTFIVRDPDGNLLLFAGPSS